MILARHADERVSVSFLRVRFFWDTQRKTETILGPPTRLDFMESKHGFFLRQKRTQSEGAQIRVLVAGSLPLKPNGEATRTSKRRIRLTTLQASQEAQSQDRSLEASRVFLNQETVFVNQESGLAARKYTDVEIFSGDALKDCILGIWCSPPTFAAA